MRMLMYLDHQTGQTVQRWVTQRGGWLVDAETLERLADRGGEVAFAARDHVEGVQLEDGWRPTKQQQPGRSAAHHTELL